MNAPPARSEVVHVSPRVQARGGIEHLHAYHRGLPGAPVLVALFDRRPRPQPGYVNLDLRWWMPLGMVRRRFAAALQPFAGATVVYHNGWGLPLFADRDGAARRVGFWHANPAYHAPYLPGCVGLVDGMIGVTPALDAAFSAALPGLPPERRLVVRAPVERPRDLVVERTRGPLVLGYAGRIERRHKRLDRLPALVRALQARGVDFRFEVLGDGSLRAPLARSLGEGVRFHGWVPRDQFWRILAGWDAVVFFSDVEGGPMALFDGMACGAIPFYPANGGSWGDVYAPQVDGRCHYPPGDMAALAAAIGDVFGAAPAQVESARRRSRELVAAHTVEAYGEALTGFLRRLAALPALPRRRPRGAQAFDCLPLGLVTRGLSRLVGSA